MRQYTLQLDEAVSETIRDGARRRKISDEQYAAQILGAHHEEFCRFPEGVLRDGRQKIIGLLSQIPCLSEFKSSGIDFRYWWVSFKIDITSQIAWRVIQKLGWLLNTQSVEMSLPTVLKPMPGERPDDAIRFEIASTKARFDPAEVVSWLSDKLPQPISDEKAWLRND